MTLKDNQLVAIHPSTSLSHKPDVIFNFWVFLIDFFEIFGKFI